MASLNPFGLNPAADGLDRFTAYWFVSLQEALYRSDHAGSTMLYGLAGGLEPVSVTVPGLLVPRCEVSSFPADRAIVTVEGTSNYLQMIAQIQGSFLSAIPPWPGSVSVWHAAVTVALWNELRPFLQGIGSPELALNGHSQGGGICQLLPAKIAADTACDIANIFSAGSPRTGNTAYAVTQTARYCRVTNAADPVPLLPPSLGVEVNQILWMLPPALPTSYVHWGTRFHLFANGSALMPLESTTWVEGSEYLIGVASGSTTWFADHAPAEYARRLRVGIPGAIGVLNPTYPGLKQIDDWWAGVSPEPPPAEWFDPATCPNL